MRLVQGLAHVVKGDEAEFDLHPGGAESERVSRAPGLLGVRKVSAFARPVPPYHRPLVTPQASRNCSTVMSRFSVASSRRFSPQPAALVLGTPLASRA